MIFNKQNSKENKRFTELLDKICSELNVDRLVALHFINNDLERICNGFQIDKIKLNQLESEINKQRKTELEIKNKIDEKETYIQTILAKKNALLSSFEEKVNLFDNEQRELSELQAKIDELNTKLRETEKKKKQLEYEVIVKNHSVKTKSNTSFKRINILLYLFTVIAVIIAIFFILHKKK